MSTKIHDFATHAVLGNSVVPQVATASQNGSAIDLLAGDGNGFATLYAGAIQAGTTVGGKVQESDNGTSGWADISGATFTDTTTANAAQAITFARTKRYVRCVVTLAGGSPQAAICAAVGQQRKRV